MDQVLPLKRTEQPADTAVLCVHLYMWQISDLSHHKILPHPHTHTCLWYHGYLPWMFKTRVKKNFKMKDICSRHFKRKLQMLWFSPIISYIAQGPLKAWRTMTCPYERQHYRRMLWMPVNRFPFQPSQHLFQKFIHYDLWHHVNTTPCLHSLCIGTWEWRQNSINGQMKVFGHVAQSWNPFFGVEWLHRSVILRHYKNICPFKKSTSFFMFGCLPTSIFWCWMFTNKNLKFPSPGWGKATFLASISQA